MEGKWDIQKIFAEYLPHINKALEKWVPRSLTQDDLLSISGLQRYSTDLQTLNKSLFEPIWELLDRGGKRWRSTLLVLIAESLGSTMDKVLDWCVFTEIIHNGTLIVDDIEDNSNFRRGKPALHKLVGVDVAINAGNFMYFLPLRILQQSNNIPKDILLRCYEIYSQEMTNLHIGQGLDIWWHNQPLSTVTADPTIDNYLQMCANKTGGLARMSAKLSALICGADHDQIEAFGKFSESLGIAFQIQDDILNIQEVSELSVSKGGVGEDIHEGKRTIMVLHSFNNATPEDAKRLREILGMHTDDIILVKEAISIINKTNSIQYAQSVAKNLMEDAWNTIDKLLPSSDAKFKLRSLVDFLISRNV